MGCHFCQDELFAVLGILAAVKYVPRYLSGMWRSRWERRHKHPNCRHHHKDVHREDS